MVTSTDLEKGEITCETDSAACVPGESNDLAENHSGKRMTVVVGRINRSQVVLWGSQEGDLSVLFKAHELAIEEHVSVERGAFLTQLMARRRSWQEHTYVSNHELTLALRFDHIHHSVGNLFCLCQGIYTTLSNVTLSALVDFFKYENEQTMAEICSRILIKDIVFQLKDHESKSAKSIFHLPFSLVDRTVTGDVFVVPVSPCVDAVDKFLRLKHGATLDSSSTDEGDINRLIAENEELRRRLNLLTVSNTN